MKRILSVMLAVVMVFGVMCSSAVAAEARYTAQQCTECLVGNLTLYKSNVRAENSYKTVWYPQSDGTYDVYAVYKLYDIFKCSNCGATLEIEVGEVEVYYYTQEPVS